jgi:hypothetical protein
MTMTGVNVFFLEETKNTRLSLRRYSRNDENIAPEHSYHDASVVVGVFPAREEASETHPGHFFDISPPLDEFIGHPLWPKECSCGYKFRLDDEYQVNTDRLYTSKQRGGTYALDDNIPGMTWDAWWYSDSWKGTDGRCLVAVCPDGKQWVIDSTCANCPIRDVDHDCWCRHGEPPLITVDKTPEPGRTTCQAGGGSIQTYKYIDGKQLPSWHGFLRNGVFVM